MLCFGLSKANFSTFTDHLNSILFGILYWYIVFVALPKWYGYSVEEEIEVLSDGTTVTKLVNIKNA